jgi:ATP-dependent Clp protease ATP-binding subunit ClpB
MDRMERRLIHLKIQREALKKEKDPASKQRLADVDAEIARLEREMKAAAANLDFERAATVRDTLKGLRTRGLGLAGGAGGVR